MSRPRLPVWVALASVAVVNTFINFNAGLTDFAKAEMAAKAR